MDFSKDPDFARELAEDHEHIVHAGFDEAARAAAKAAWGFNKVPHARRRGLLGGRRGDAAAATRIFGGGESRRRRGCDVDILWR